MAEKIMVSTVIVNNDVIAIIPGSCEFKPGFGDITPKVASAGGRSVELYLTEDPTTQLGMVKFELYNSKKNRTLVNEWVSLSRDENGNVISIIDSTDGSTESYSEMFVTNDPSFTTGTDGKIEVEFQGRGPATS